MIDLMRLKVLLALYEHGTLHAAADTLHVSASAASQQLANLAKAVGAPLTEADGRRLRLTDAGLVLVEHAYTLLAQVERAEGDLEAASGGELGQLTVGSFPSTITSILVPAARMIRGRRPSLRIDIREVKAPDFLDELSGGDLDVVVAVEAEGAPSPDDLRFTRIALGTDDFDLALPAGHPLASRKEVELSLLAQEDWVSTIKGDACDQLLWMACSSVGFRPRVRHRASDWLAILAMVEAGFGVAFVPGLAQLPAPDSVVIVPTTGHAIRRHVYAAVRRGAETRPTVATFLAALEEVGIVNAGLSPRPVVSQ